MKKITEPKKTMIERIKDWVWWYGADVLKIVAVLGIVGAVYGINVLEKRHCFSAYAQFGPEYPDFITGCMITVDEQRVPAKTLRMTL